MTLERELRKDILQLIDDGKLSIEHNREKLKNDKAAYLILLHKTFDVKKARYYVNLLPSPKLVSVNREMEGPLEVVIKAAEDAFMKENKTKNIAADYEILIKLGRAYYRVPQEFLPKYLRK